jgi:DNA-binding transcriptional LysR family regulator
MDTESLRAFVTIARCGSFSIAAQQLFLTQPAISKRIAKLEERLNHRLFDRMGRELQLTEAGRALLPRAEAILRDIGDLERSIRDLSGEIVGTLRVATSPHIGLHHLPPILREFASAHANVNLQFEFLDSELAHDKVTTGDCELAVVTLDPNMESHLESFTIWEDPMFAVASIDHELAQLAQVDLNALSSCPAILPDLNTYTGRIIQSTFDSAELRIQINMATNNLETINMMVSVGLGWSILPKTLIDDSMKVLAVKDLRVLSRKLGVVKHKRRSLSNAGSAFLDLIQSSG